MGVTIVVLVGASVLGVTFPVPLMIAFVVGAIFTRLVLDSPEACRDPLDRDLFDR